MSAPLSLPGRSLFLSSGTLLVLLTLLTALPAQTSSAAFPVISLVEITVEFPAPSLPSVFSRPLGAGLFADDWFRTPWTYPADPRVLHRTGFGILIDPRGYIMTSQHLVGYPGDYQKLTVRILSPVAASPAGGAASASPTLTSAGAGPPLTGRLVAADPAHDLALLLLNDPPAGPASPPEWAADLATLEPGSVVSLLVGSPAGSDLSDLALIPSEVAPYGRWPSGDPQATARLLDPWLGETREVAGLIPVRFKAHAPAAAATPSAATTIAPTAPSAAIAPLPGSPAFDMNGRVIGLVTGLVTTSDPHLAFLIPLQAGLDLLSDLQESEDRLRRVTGG